jgi:hypothetical protein
MRTTVTISEASVKAAQDYTGIKSKSELIDFVLDDFNRRAAMSRLAELGGTMPELDFADPRRRRYER